MSVLSLQWGVFRLVRDLAREIVGEGLQLWEPSEERVRINLKCKIGF